MQWSPMKSPTWHPNFCWFLLYCSRFWAACLECHDGKHYVLALRLSPGGSQRSSRNELMCYPTGPLLMLDGCWWFVLNMFCMLLYINLFFSTRQLSSFNIPARDASGQWRFCLSWFRFVSWTIELYLFHGSLKSVFKSCSLKHLQLWHSLWSLFHFSSGWRPILRCIKLIVRTDIVLTCINTSFTAC